MSSPTDEEFYALDETGDRKPNGQFLKQHFFREGRLTEEQALFILEKATALLATEPNLVDVASPVTSQSPPSLHVGVPRLTYEID